VMREDVLYARKAGIDIVVLGLLHADQTVDLERTRELVELAQPLEVTFHRAFDVTPDLSEALGRVIESGASRILTAGGEASAALGAAKVKKLRASAADRIGFLLCGGITATNVCSALETVDVSEVHAGLGSSARAAVAEGNYDKFAESVKALRAKI
jgi:copper homeostasis protein